MHALRNILLLFALLTMALMCVAMPMDDEASALELEDRAAELDEVDVLDTLAGRDDAEIAASCQTTSRRGRNCTINQCPGRTQCKVSRTGRCVWAKPKRQRPSGCDNCRCYK